MTMMASQITSLTVVYLIVYSGADQRKHQSSASLAFVHKGPVTRKMFPFGDVIRSRVAYGSGKWKIIGTRAGLQIKQKKNLNDDLCYTVGYSTTILVYK